ncbi:MAG: class I SAM-dependent methyltransferase [Bacteroidetes bacterium]|nr:class I SAM-dependent methyltransferase [Bacteroidota bacterium]
MNKRVIQFLGGKKNKQLAYPPDIAQQKDFLEMYEKCKPFTMTSIERMYALYTSINYIVKNGISGDFVECGVWKGGSSMMIALALLHHQIRDRKIFLYDTFEGMSAPTDDDISFSGESAAALLSVQKKEKDDSIWCFSPIDEVKNNLHATGYPDDMLHFVKGKVEDTLPHVQPGKIALLRLDTDWYESTKTEMHILYPLLVQKGILIIDDFGHWEGSKKAIVEYFDKQQYQPMLQRIDYTGILMVKQES